MAKGLGKVICARWGRVWWASLCVCCLEKRPAQRMSDEVGEWAGRARPTAAAGLRSALLMVCGLARTWSSRTVASCSVRGGGGGGWPVHVRTRLEERAAPERMGGAATTDVRRGKRGGPGASARQLP